MSVARKILENTFIQIIGKLVTAGMSIIVLKIISGYMGTAGYGDYTTAYQFIAFFGIAADFGIYTITVKEMSKDMKKIPMILGNVMSLRTLLCLISMSAATLVAFLIPSYEGTLIPFGIVIVAFATVFNLLNGTVSSVLQTHLKMQYATIGMVIGKIISVGYMALTAYYLFVTDAISGFYHLLLAGVIGNLVMFIITAFYVRRYCRITYRFDFDFWKKIFITSLPYGVALVLSTVYFRLDVILMTLLLPHSSVAADGAARCMHPMCGDTEVGLYGVAMRFLEMLVIIPVYFMNSVLPVMTRFIEEKSQKIQQLMQYSFDFLIATSVPILIGGFILAKPIILFISDPEFISGHTYYSGSDVAVRILMFAMLFSFISTLFGFTLIVLNKQTKLMMVNAGCVLLNLVGNLLVIPYWGFRGAAFTSVFSGLFVLLLTGWIVKKALGFKLSAVTMMKVIFSSLVMGAVVFVGMDLLKKSWFIWQLAVLIPLGGAAYVIMMIKTKAVTKEMWELIRRK